MLTSPVHISMGYSDCGMGIQKSFFQVLKIGAQQENTALGRLGLTSTKTSNFYTHVSNRDLSRMNSPLDKIMQGAFDDNGIGFRQRDV